MDLPLNKLYKGQPISQIQIKNICKKSKEIFIQQTNIVEIHLPVIVCGDIHGQFQDLIQIFEIGGRIPDTNYLFLGDYVNRGYNSIQTILLLLLLKIKYPNRITLLRGNHESRQITQTYGFYDECARKYPEYPVWKYITDTFDFLPAASIVQGQYFCVHAGLSPSMQKLDDLKKLERFDEIPYEGILCDILWTDPQELPGWRIVPRGTGYLFGPDITEQFLFQNNLNKIVRAHQLINQGYKQMHNSQILSIFSAPNYCYRCGNQGAILEIDENSNKTCIRYDMDKRDGPQIVFKDNDKY